MKVYFHNEKRSHFLSNRVHNICVNEQVLSFLKIILISYLFITVHVTIKSGPKKTVKFTPFHMQNCSYLAHTFSKCETLTLLTPLKRGCECENIQVITFWVLNRKTGSGRRTKVIQCVLLINKDFAQLEMLLLNILKLPVGSSSKGAIHCLSRRCLPINIFLGVIWEVPPKSE